MRKKKQTKADNKIIDTILQYQKDFNEICQSWGINTNVEDRTTLVPVLVEYADLWIHCNMCHYFKHKASLEESAKNTIKELTGFKGITSSDLASMVEVNLKVEKGELTKKYIDSKTQKHDSSLFISNMIKRTFDSAIDDTLTDTNHVVIPKKSKLKFVNDTDKSTALSRLVTDLTDSRRYYENVISPEYDKILHAISYASNCVLSAEDARLIMRFAHCPDGNWDVVKSRMHSLSEKIGNAYRIITKQNLNFHKDLNADLDEFNLWLGLHGLKLVDVDFDNKEKQYRDVMAKAEEHYKKDEDGNKKEYYMQAITLLQYLVYGEKKGIDPYFEELKEQYGIRSEYMIEKRRQEFNEVLARAK